MRKFISIFLLILTTSCSSTSKTFDDQICAFPSKANLILNKGENLLQYWDYKKGSLSKKNFKNLIFLKSYQKRVQAKVKDLRQKSLIKRSYHLEKAGDQQNSRVVEHLLESVRPLNCQEALLLNLQGSRVDLVIKPTEFLAFELSRENETRLVYFTSNVNGVRGLGSLHEKIQAFVNEGWSLEKNIHNHILNLNDKNYRGTLGPSVSDAFVFLMELKDFNLKTAVITNGFESMETPSIFFEKLSTKY